MVHLTEDADIVEKDRQDEKVSTDEKVFFIRQFLGIMLQPAATAASAGPGGARLHMGMAWHANAGSHSGEWVYP